MSLVLGLTVPIDSQFDSPVQRMQRNGVENVGEKLLILTDLCIHEISIARHFGR
jgi:hypothetical protein